MSVNRTYDRSKVLVGEARPFIQPYDPESPPELPANSVPINGAWGTPWVELGATRDGLTFKFARSIKKHMIEEQQTPVQISTTDTTFSFMLNLAEDTLDAKRIAYGGGTIITTTPTSTLPGTRELRISSDLGLFGFGFEGRNEWGFWTRVLVPIVVSISDAETGYRRAEDYRSTAITLESLVDVDDVTILEANVPATV